MERNRPELVQYFQHFLHCQIRFGLLAHRPIFPRSQSRSHRQTRQFDCADSVLFGQCLTGDPVWSKFCRQTSMVVSTFKFRLPRAWLKWHIESSISRQVCHLSHDYPLTGPQMEGSSGSPGPTGTTSYKVRNFSVTRTGN